MRSGVLLTAALFLCLAGIEGASGETGEAGSAAKAAAAARTYVEAYNRRDGGAMCRAFSPELHEWFMQLPGLRPGLSCARIATARIGYGEESDTPIFQRLKILSVVPSVNGEQARVTVKARYRYKKYRGIVSPTVTDQIYLVDRAGEWRVAKPGGVWFFTQSAYNVPENTLDPPISDAEAHQPAPQPPASFECADAQAKAIDDASGDAPASLDVRRASSSVNKDGSVCLRIAFQSPPRPGTNLGLRLEQTQQAKRRMFMTEASIRIGSGGGFHFTHIRHATEDASKRFQAGWVGGELRVLWLAQKGPAVGAYTLRWGGVTRTLQFWEPLIKDPMAGRGEPWEGRGDSFGRAF